MNDNDVLNLVNNNHERAVWERNNRLRRNYPVQDPVLPKKPYTPKKYKSKSRLSKMHPHLKKSLIFLLSAAMGVGVLTYKAPDILQTISQARTAISDIFTSDSKDSESLGYEYYSEDFPELRSLNNNYKYITEEVKPDEAYGHTRGLILIYDDVANNIVFTKVANAYNKYFAQKGEDKSLSPDDLNFGYNKNDDSYYIYTDKTGTKLNLGNNAVISDYAKSSKEMINTLSGYEVSTNLQLQYLQDNLAKLNNIANSEIQFEENEKGDLSFSVNSPEQEQDGNTLNNEEEDLEL